MMNITRSVVLPPICGPQLMPEISNGAGALQAPPLRQVATPVPCSPPTTNAPLVSLGITATHFASENTLSGMPLSPAVFILCTVLVASCSSDWLPFSSESLAQLTTAVHNQLTTAVHNKIDNKTVLMSIPPGSSSVSSEYLDVRNLWSYARA